MRLIPLEHPIPAGIDHDRFRLRILTVDDVVADYDAVMSSAERLRERFPYWGWPDPGMTLDRRPGRPRLASEGGAAAALVQLRGDVPRRATGCSAASTSTRPRSRVPTPRSASGCAADEEDGDLEQVLEAAVRELARRRVAVRDDPLARARDLLGGLGRAARRLTGARRCGRAPDGARCLCNDDRDGG